MSGVSKRNAHLRGVQEILSQSHNRVGEKRKRVESDTGVAAAALCAFSVLLASVKPASFLDGFEFNSSCDAWLDDLPLDNGVLDLTWVADADLYLRGAYRGKSRASMFRHAKVERVEKKSLALEAARDTAMMPMKRTQTKLPFKIASAITSPSSAFGGSICRCF